MTVEIDQRIREIRDVLCLLHPVILDLDHPVPLKIGIRADFVALYPDLDPKLLRRMLTWLTMRRAYLRICREGAMRYGIDGGPAGSVTAEQEAWARKMYEFRVVLAHQHKGTRREVKRKLQEDRP